ncbi:MAG: VOC family protein [Actinobacteria bacterium]|nr:VOC family protein [Actinomycetota bacterium]
MLGDHQAIATLAVKDLDAAREFYEGVLGFVPRREVAEGVLYAAGTRDFLVYPSSFAGTNQATALSFQVPAD